MMSVLRASALLLALLLAALPLVHGVEGNDPGSEQRRVLLSAVAAAVAEDRIAEAAALLADQAEDDHYLTHTWRGRVAALGEEWSAATGHYQRALAQRSTYRPAAEGLIQSLAMAEEWQDLVRTIGPWLEQVDSPQPWWHTAIHGALAIGDSVVAEELARRALLRFPQSLPIRRSLAHILRQHGDLRGAAQTWQGVIEAAQGSAVEQAHDWYQWALLAEQLGDSSQARQALMVAHHLNPGDSAIAESYLAILLDHGQQHSAWALTQQLIAEGEGHSARRWQLAAQAAEGQGEHGQGLEFLQQVDPAQRATHWHLLAARLAALDDDAPTALAAIDQLIHQGQASAELRLWAAHLAQQGDDGLAAEAHLRALMVEFPDWRERAQLQLIRLLLGQQRPAEARALLDQALDEAPYDRNLQRLRHAMPEP